ncbi:MAG: amidohydrolase [Pyrinomonadaceae bacterium]|nr:amidohydrolase [Pyrinomonadaceae bacterium]
MRLRSVFIIALLAATAFAQSAADLVIVNADIRTMDRSLPRAEALAVTGNKIAAVGSNAAIRKLIGPKTNVVDASGRLLLPGFNDAHVHFMAIGNKFSSIDLSGFGSTADIVRELEYYVRFLPKRRWILGGRWRFELWQNGERPDRKLIDAATPNNPVLIYNSEPSTALVNSVALGLAGITKLTKDPQGGEIVRGPDDEPTGLLKGKAIDLVSRLVPENHTRNWKEIAETATNYAASLGVTSVQDVHSDDLLAVYRDLESQGKLKTRVYDCVSLSDWAKTRRAFDIGNGSLARQGCVKSFTEGDDEWTPTLKADVLAADKAGVQVAVHAIGTRPNEIIAGVYDDIVRTNGPRDRRFRAEHAERPNDETLRKYAELGVIASVQPYLFTSGLSGAYRRMSDANVRLAFGSDAPMTEFDPMFAIFASGTLSLEEGVRAYTLGSAYAEFQETVKGTISKGKLADFVILSDNFFEPAPKRAARPFVLLTVVDGEVVYEHSSFKHVDVVRRFVYGFAAR